MDSSNNERDTGTNSCTKSRNVPTLKYLVSQSLGSCFDQEQENNVHNNREEKGETAEGSGDIAGGALFQRPVELDLDVSNLLSTAYEKGAEWLQAGADIAYNMFGSGMVDELAAHKADPAACAHLQSVTKIATEKTLESIFGNCTISSKSNKVEVEKSNKVAQDLVPVSHCVDEKEVKDTDDAAYYNGYNIRVRGKGISLDTMFVNGSGPSSKSLEIRIRLQRPLHDPNPYGKLIREHGGPEDQTLLLQYTHGFVRGCVDITCPQEVDTFNLTCTITKDGFMVITAP